jgi:hypothetical protein
LSPAGTLLVALARNASERIEAVLPILEDHELDELVEMLRTYLK